MQKEPRVGIPRTLSYYTYYPLWKVFFEKLGFRVVLSNQTNRAILEEGIKDTVNDACIPIKVFHGHVADLVGRVDYIFVPRMVCADGKSTFCPKFLGLPDMVRYNVDRLPNIIDSRYNCRFPVLGLLAFFFSVASQIGVKNPLTIAYAACSALICQGRYQRLLLKGIRPQRALTMIGRDAKEAEDPGLIDRQVLKNPDRIVIALLGYPYAIHDRFISAGVCDKLDKLGVEVLTFEQIPSRAMRRMEKQMPQSFFWYYSNQVCWAGLHLLEEDDAVDGIIHITAFGCGPDAMVDKLLELEARAKGVPFLSLAIDEHTGEGGVQTRLEAFADMLGRQKRKSRAG